MGLTSQRYKDTLAKVQLTESETALLFELIDANKDGVLSPFEFCSGIRLFAPGIALEDLRLRCLARHACPADAFAGVLPSKHHEVLSADALCALLDELGLADGVDVHGVADLLEPHADG